MVAYAIVEACGKQFWLEEGRFYDFDKLPLTRGDQFTLNNILLLNDGANIFVGRPYLGGQYSVDVEVLRHISGSKVRVYKMRSKKKTRKTRGSRATLTRILVKSISEKSQVKTSCRIN